MILVCSDHVKDGIELLHAPHIKRNDMKSPCRFCHNEASFEIYYFKVLEEVN